VTSKLLFTFGGVLIAFLAFGVGYWWKGERLGALDRFEVKKPLEIQVAPTKKGVLPEGAVLYEYRVLPETTTYILFVNSKNRDLLAPRPGGEHKVVIEPVDAYPAEKG